jgi:hypothetical protein
MPNRYKMLETLMGEVGGEFSAAYTEAVALGDCAIVLGDRDYEITKARMQV